MPGGSFLSRLFASAPTTAALGGAMGIIAVALGLRFHIGTVYVDGTAGFVGSAIVGALAALLIRYAVRKEYGWP